METKYQIFISSTFTDLEEERDGIIKAILELYHIPIGMEMFSAGDEDQWKIISDTIRNCDYYILILGLRYGSETAEKISFTQKEYEFALEQKIPILAFLLKEDAPLSKKQRDDDLSKINKFREIVLTNSKMSDFWNNKDELVKKVSISLIKQMRQKPQIGWIRGDLGVSTQLSDELTQLSKENRLLRDRIQDLESKIPQRKPYLQLFINENEINTCTLKYTDPNINNIMMPSTLNLELVPSHLKKYLTQKDIDQYNNQLPTQKVLNKYNHDRQIFEKSKINSQNLVLSVANGGTIKANQIYVHITFPKEVIVYEVDQLENLEEPKNPLPYDPIKRAENQFKNDNEKPASPIKLVFPHNFSDFNTMTLSPRISHLASSLLDPNRSCRLKDNKIRLSLNSLLHTMQVDFQDNYKIVPLTYGEFEIEVSYICEEYEEQSVMTIPLIITKK